MKRQRPDGITVQCIACKRHLIIGFEEAAAMTEQPYCDRCLMPMVATEAKVSVK